jgi:uncharacterized protein
MLASGRGDSSGVQELLHSSALAQVKDKDGSTALHIAVCHGHSLIVDQLLGAGVEPNVQNNYGYSVLSDAVVGGRVPIVNRLLTAGADPGLATNHGQSILHLASMHGHAAILKLFLSVTNLDPAAGDYHGWTPFHVAVFHQQESVLQILSAYAKDKSCKSWYPLAPLVSSDFSLRDELSHTAPITDNSLGWTSAHVAALLEMHNILDWLVCSGINIFAKDNNGMSPLHWAAAAGLDKTVEKILKLGDELSINSKDRWERIPYDIAFKPSTVEMLSSSPETRLHALPRESWIQNSFFSHICDECLVHLDGLFSCERKTFFVKLPLTINVLTFM